MFEPAVETTPSVQNRSLMPSGMPSSAPPSPRAILSSEAAAIASACSGVSQHIGVERPRLLDRGDMGLGQFGGGEALGLQAVTGFGEREMGQFGHDI